VDERRGLDGAGHRHLVRTPRNGDDRGPVPPDRGDHVDQPTGRAHVVGTKDGGPQPGSDGRGGEASLEPVLDREPEVSPTNRDNACSTGSPAAASRRPLRSWVPTRVVRRADMTDLLNSEKAASKARDLLASRVTFIEKLADAAQGERRRP